jgi:hypothetical protein
VQFLGRKYPSSRSSFLVVCCWRSIPRTYQEASGSSPVSSGPQERFAATFRRYGGTPGVRAIGSAARL